MKQLFKLLLNFFTKRNNSFKLKIVPELPEKPIDYVLYLEGNSKANDYWYALLNCPCGCGDIIMLNLMRDSKPCWRVVLNKKKPSIYPSVWRTKNCKSHFWLKKGKVFWA